MKNKMIDELRRYTVQQGMVYDTWKHEYLTCNEIIRILNNVEEDEGKSYR